jgi:hypothetical protein
MAIRASVHQIGVSLLEKLLNAGDNGYRGATLDCGSGHQARFVEYRAKGVTTVLGEVKIDRGYYHCARCHSGVIPKDEELDISGTSFSPGVQRMIGRVGAKGSFEEGRCDIKELAGIEVKTKEVERISEGIGEQVQAWATMERQLVQQGKLIPMKAAVPKFYIEMDGVQVPVIPRETEGRRGRDGTERAKTREAKLGCVFTQTGVDEKGYPVRDDESTTYVGAIEMAEEFGLRIYTEAVRRGLKYAQIVVVLGDGAPWIWVLADLHFYGAIQIVDLYHARQHLIILANLVYGAASVKAKLWASERRAQLDLGDVEAVVRAIKRLRPREASLKEEVRRAVVYFETNAERMRYADFRKQGLFVGSGVIEAGCKTVIGQRLKQSGMHWSVKGANAIAALRCCQMSGRWQEFWEVRAVS